jgi:pentatricopeptide repeat protein
MICNVCVDDRRWSFGATKLSNAHFHRQAISCCEHRWDGALRFYELMQRKGFTCTRVPRKEMDPVYGGDDFFLYVMKKT